ncbi:MAG TPA: restriction endonuclease subunit S [Pyrinomonadaceae bacterium]|nr:restriction endonuclease subunit S [Pyrinomonadaceae bacterium]
MNDYREFYNFPSDWSPISLLNSTYLKGRIGWQGLKASEFTTDGPYLVTGTNFVNGRIDWDHCYHITDERFREAPDIHLKESDLLITKDGTIGKVALVKDCPDETTLNSGIFLLRCKDKSYSHSFLYYFLLSDYFKKYLRDTQGGSTIVHLYQREFERFTFKAPEIAEQERIAEILSTVDRAIEQTQGLIDKYNRIKGGLMQDLLTRGIDESGNIRSNETHKFSVKNGIKVPDEWDVVTIGCLSEQITSGSRGWATHYSVDGDKFIRIGNLSRKHLDFRLDNMVFVNPPDGAERVRTKLIEGDVLVSITADLGMVGVIPKDFGDAYNNQHIARIRIRENDASTRWIGYFLLSKNGQAQFQMLNESGAKAGLNLPTVASLLVAVPSTVERQRIVAILDSTLNTIECHRQSLVKLHATKNGLLQDLLSGRKRVKIDALEV